MFKSILGSLDIASMPTAAPETLDDLELKKIFADIFTIYGDIPNDLDKLYATPLTDLATVRYRQQVMQDFQQNSLYNCFKAFVQELGTALDAKSHSQKTYYRNKGECVFLQGILTYLDSIDTLSSFLQTKQFTSDGLRDFCDYLQKYCAAPRFQQMKARALAVREALTALAYTLAIRENTIFVELYDGQKERAPQLCAFFQKFAQAAPKEYHFEIDNDDFLNHIDEQICDRLALLVPKPFNLLHAFYSDYYDFLPELLRNFYYDIQFYLSYQKYMDSLPGIAFCLPQLEAEPQQLCCTEGTNLSLVHVGAAFQIVPNSYALKNGERLLIITGPNQGGKTTFLRLIGQINYLGALGLPVPAKNATVLLADNIFTHFERREDREAVNGCLQDDLLRIHAILEKATARSLIIINEMFATTTLDDALLLGQKILQQFTERGCFCAYVTFLDALSHFNQQTVSMVSLMNDDAHSRTYKIERRPADGKAYALSIAAKYALTYDDILRRVQ